MIEYPQKRIVITGTFCSLNKGDAAMRIALTCEIKKAIPNSYITIMTPYPELDSGAYCCDRIYPTSRRRPSKAVSMIGRALIWNIINRISGIEWSALLDEELKVYAESDLVIDASGDGLTEEYGLKCILSHYIPIILGKLLRKPVYVCAQTIGPLTKTKRLCRYLLRRVERITAREQITYDYLNSLGIKPPSLEMTADVAFLIEPSSTKRGKQILHDEEVPNDKPLIGFTVSRLPGHILGHSSSSKPCNYELEMAKTLDMIIKMDLRPVLLSHTTGPGPARDDRVTAHRIAMLTSKPSQVSVIAGDYSVEDIKSVIGLMDMLVGARMHSCISSLSMYVPTVAIAFGPKAHGIMELAGQGEWTMNINDVSSTSMFQLINRCWESRKSITHSLHNQMPTVVLRAHRNIEIVSQMLGTTASQTDQDTLLESSRGGGK